jgi:hypothetical protein
LEECAAYIFKGLFNTENGRTMFLQNVSKLLPDFTASHLRKQQSSVTIVRISNLTTDRMTVLYIFVCVSENCCYGTLGFQFIMFSLTSAMLKEFRWGRL